MPNRCFSFSWIQSATLVAAVFTLFASPCSGQDGAQQSSQQNENSAEAFAPRESVIFMEPSNTRVSFVGTHVGDDPKPRLGGFAKFDGVIRFKKFTKAIRSISLNIDMNSVWTEFDGLTKHLKNADFLDVEKFGHAHFSSQKIRMKEDGTCTVVGNLTLHGKTNEIKFPAKYQYTMDGMSLTAKLSIDRSQFGMDQMLGGVEKSVAIEFCVGQKTVVPNAKGGHGGDTKKKQSSQSTESDRQLVSLMLPKML